MIRVCAWCGILMGEVPPFQDRTPTHGVCPRCLDRMQRGLDQPPEGQLPPCHWLVLVPRAQPELYWHLRAAFEDLPRVYVARDRRREERRRAGIAVVSERRRQDRRRPLRPAERALWGLGVRVIHQVPQPCAQRA